MTQPTVQAAVRGVLLDVEGTTSSIQFVYEVMFPFARRGLDAYLQSNWDSSACREACEQIATDAGHQSLAAWAAGQQAKPQALIAAEATRLMDNDIKSTGLKQLQGLIWRAGFESRQMIAHIYPDVPPALEAWQSAGINLRVYSSGSVEAQRLFFGHTKHGDLSRHFTGHHDTRVGPKRQTESYQRIADHWGVEANDVLFLSDISEELDAAHDAGMQTALLLRPGNKPQRHGHGHTQISSFGQLKLAKR